MEIALSPISIDEKGTLRDMLYEYELEITGSDPGEYKYLDSYWEKTNRHPYFINVDGKLAGFALINCHTLVAKEAKNMSEFYVKKDYRKLGVGKEAARLAFKLFPGKWEVREMHSNKPAVAFWNRTISEITSDKFDQVIMENDLWNGPIQTFDILA